MVTLPSPTWHASARWRARSARLDVVKVAFGRLQGWKPRGRKTIRSVLWIVAALIGIIGLLTLSQRRLIYLPSQTVPLIGGELTGWEEVAFDTSDGLTLQGWFTPPEAIAPVVIVFNGNAGNRADRLPLGMGLAEKGFGVLLFDYRGYGGNPGHPSESGLTRDARAATAWVRMRAPDNPLVYFGESLGAAVAIELALDHPPAALALRSPFTTLADVAADHYWFLPVRTLLWDEYPSIDRIREVATPTLVIAGSADEIVTLDQSRAIYAAAPEPKELLVIDGAGHNDAALVAGSAVVDVTTRFSIDVISE